MKKREDADAGSETLKDGRLSPWPKVRRKGKDLVMKFCVMTPLRLFMIEDLIFGPLIFIWRFFTVIFVIALLLHIFNGPDLFRYVPLTGYSLALAIPATFRVLERSAGYPVCGFLFGRHVSIRITDENVKVRLGWFSWPNSFDRAHRIAFVRIPFEQSQTAIYGNSEFLCVIIGDARHERLLEVFNPRRLERIITNANLALQLHHTDHDVDREREFASQPDTDTA